MVTKRYNNQANVAVKEEWKMTQYDFVSRKWKEWWAVANKHGTIRQIDPPIKLWKDMHKNIVKAAVFLHKDVPVWIIASYKDEKWAKDILEGIFPLPPEN